MDTDQTELFESPNKLHFQRGTIKTLDSAEPDTSPAGNRKPAISDIDHHMIDIISEYIKKLPDNDTRKYIARLMINFIMKSANL